MLSSHFLSAITVCNFRALTRCSEVGASADRAHRGRWVRESLASEGKPVPPSVGAEYVVTAVCFSPFVAAAGRVVLPVRGEARVGHRGWQHEEHPAKKHSQAVTLMHVC